MLTKTKWTHEKHFLKEMEPIHQSVLDFRFDYHYTADAAYY